MTGEAGRVSPPQELRAKVTPASEASTSTTTCREGSGRVRTGVVVKQCLNSLKAFSADWDHIKGVFWEVGCIEECCHRSVVPDEAQVEIGEP